MKDGATILVVEDNPDDADLIKHAFRKAKLPHALHLASDGDAAIDYLAGQAPYDDRQRHPLPAVILLDLKLPRRSGFEVLRWIRDNPQTKHLPVVVLTSSGQDQDIRRAYDLCANSYLVKPVRTEALLDMVQSLNHYWLVLNQTA